MWIVRASLKYPYAAAVLAFSAPVLALERIGWSHRPPGRPYLLFV
jgi:hypothetical protein